MLTGKKYRIKTPTLGLTDPTDGDSQRRVVTVPANSVVRILSGPLVPEDRMVDVLFDGQQLAMFVRDLRDRGEEVQETSGTQI